MKGFILGLGLLGLVGCGKEGAKAPAGPPFAYDRVVYSCGPALPCPLYVVGQDAYYQASDGTYQKL